MPRARPLRPVLITSAGQSRRDEIRHRERRYVMTMMVRVVLFIVAVVALRGWARLPGVVAAICIPWLAVLYANAGPIRSRSGCPSLYTRDTSALPDDPYPLGDGGQTIVEGEWTGPGQSRDRPRREVDPLALPGAVSGGERGPSAAVAVSVSDSVPPVAGRFPPLLIAPGTAGPWRRPVPPRRSTAAGVAGVA